MTFGAAEEIGLDDGTRVCWITVGDEPTTSDAALANVCLARTAADFFVIASEAGDLAGAADVVARHDHADADVVVILVNQRPVLVSYDRTKLYAAGGFDAWSTSKPWWIAPDERIAARGGRVAGFPVDADLAPLAALPPTAEPTEGSSGVDKAHLMVVAPPGTNLPGLRQFLTSMTPDWFEVHNVDDVAALVAATHETPQHVLTTLAADVAASLWWHPRIVVVVPSVAARLDHELGLTAEQTMALTGADICERTKRGSLTKIMTGSWLAPHDPRARGTLPADHPQWAPLIPDGHQFLAPMLRTLADLCWPTTTYTPSPAPALHPTALRFVEASEPADCAHIADAVEHARALGEQWGHRWDRDVRFLELCEQTQAALPDPSHTKASVDATA